VAIKSITEFTIQPGRRDEFVSLFESLVAQHLSTLRDAGCSEVTLYAVVDDPDKAVEIADWESGQARDAAMQSGAFGVFAPLFELLAGPISATVVEPLH
jgi:quinol monooxygenase YgiN